MVTRGGSSRLTLLFVLERGSCTKALDSLAAPNSRAKNISWPPGARVTLLVYATSLSIALFHLFCFPLGMSPPPLSSLVRFTIRCPFSPSSPLVSSGLQFFSHSLLPSAAPPPRRVTVVVTVRGQQGPVKYLPVVIGRRTSHAWAICGAGSHGKHSQV